MHKNKKASNIRRFLSYYKPHRSLFIMLMLASVVTAGMSLALPLCVRHITGNILASGARDVLPEILCTGALMAVIIIVQTGAGIFIDWMGHIMGARIERGLRAELFSHYQKLPFSFYDDRNTGELMSRLTNDLFSISEVYHHVPAMALTYFIQFTGSIIILLYINWRLGLLIFAVLLVMAVYSVAFYRKLQVSYRVNQERMADVNAAAQENLAGIRVVKSFANEDVEAEKFAVENNRFYQSRAEIYKRESLLLSVVEYFFTPLITVMIVVAGGVWIARGQLEIASLLVFVMYVAYLTGPVPKMAELIPFFQSGFIGFVRFQEIMDTVPDVSDVENAMELDIAKGRVTFENVTFKYPSALLSNSPDAPSAGGVNDAPVLLKGELDKHEDCVLRNINLDVQPGEAVAIIGRSGIGKSTLCSLIPRFYDVTGGAVRIDGIDVRDVTLKSLRKQIGVVRQETFLFAGTVMENILYGRPGATAAEAIEAAKQANAHEFITKLPNGYDTNIGQRGVKLSGGQQQRLSIARVFLKDPPVLIFDEATSSLDTENEKAVMDSLYALAKGRTTFIIAHRPSTIQNVNRVIELTDDGIAEVIAPD